VEDLIPNLDKEISSTASSTIMEIRMLRLERAGEKVVKRLLLLYLRESHNFPRFGGGVREPLKFFNL